MQPVYRLYKGCIISLIFDQEFPRLITPKSGDFILSERIMSALEEYLQQEANAQTDSSNRLLRDIAYDRLKDAIRHSAVPGQPLSENRLSKALGISRTPVREALQQLAQEGLVQIIPGRTMIVSEPTMREVLDVVHVRSLIEPELMRLVAENIDEAALKRLEQVLQRMEDTARQRDLIAWSEADTEFHEIIARACPNPLLGELSLQMRNRVHYQANIDSKTNPARLLACTAEHRDIVTMIAKRDGGKAAEATAHHLQQMRQSLFTRLGYHASM